MDERKIEVRDAYRWAFIQLSEGVNASLVLADFIRVGWDQGVAADIVNRVKATLKEDRLEQANSDILKGSLWFVGGVIVTGGGYLLTGGGGSYLVTFGAIIFGGYQLLKGLSRRFM